MSHSAREAVRCAMVALFLIVVVAEGAEQLLRNPSFEQPLDPGNWGCDMAAGWIRWGNWMNRETGWTPVKTGECIMGFHHWRLKGEDNAGFYQDVDGTRVGQRYTFSILAQRDKGTNAKEIRLSTHSYHGGSVLATRIYSIESLDNDEWNRLSVTTTPPSVGVRVMVIVEPKSTGMRKGAVKFDDATLARMEE